MEMEVYFAQSIKNARKISLLAGQAKYRAYFITLTKFEEYRIATEALLVIEGIEDCIVSV